MDSVQRWLRWAEPGDCLVVEADGAGRVGRTSGDHAGVAAAWHAGLVQLEFRGATAVLRRTSRPFVAEDLVRARRVVLGTHGWEPQRCSWCGAPIVRARAAAGSDVCSAECEERLGGLLLEEGGA